MNVKRGIARRNWRCNFRPAIARMKPSVRWKNEPVRELLLSLLDPLNLPMRHDWAAVHAEHFAPIAGGQIDSAVS